MYKHTDTYDTSVKYGMKMKDHNRLLKKYYQNFPSMYKFIELMSTTNIKDFRKLAEFAMIIIQKFQ